MEHVNRIVSLSYTTNIAVRRMVIGLMQETCALQIAQTVIVHEQAIVLIRLSVALLLQIIMTVIFLLLQKQNIAVTPVLQMENEQQGYPVLFQTFLVAPVICLDSKCVI